MIDYLMSTTEIPMFAVLLIAALVVGSFALAVMTLLDKTEDTLRLELHQTQCNEALLIAQLRVARDALANKRRTSAGRTNLTCALATDENGKRYNAASIDDTIDYVIRGD
jgi:sensor histidine kinase regulating citrate/malate metabolism